MWMSGHITSRLPWSCRSSGRRCWSGHHPPPLLLVFCLSILGCCLPISFSVFCRPLLLPPCTVPCKNVLARPDDWETCPYHIIMFAFFHCTQKVFIGSNALPNFTQRPMSMCYGEKVLLALMKIGQLIFRFTQISDYQQNIDVSPPPLSLSLSLSLSLWFIWG